MNYVDIGLRLRHIRGKISQKDFGIQFNVSKSYVNNVEHGSKPSLEFLIKVAVAFDASLDWILLGRQSLPSELSPSTEGVQSAITKENLLRNELLQIFDTLPPAVQPVIIGTVKTILQHSTDVPSPLMKSLASETSTPKNEFE